jgi:hypothetical protein
MNDDLVHIAQTDDGKWVAATASSPYFCFTAESESEVTAIAARALRFYQSAPRLAHTSTRGRIEATPSHNKRTVSARQLACA